MHKPTILLSISKLKDRIPQYVHLNGLDLVVISYDKKVSVLYGRCLHRGAILADGHIEGNNLICGLHNWDYRIDTGVSEYNNQEALHKFNSSIFEKNIIVDAKEISDFLEKHPQPFHGNEYLGLYADTHPEDTEPALIG